MDGCAGEYCILLFSLCDVMFCLHTFLCLSSLGEPLGDGLSGPAAFRPSVMMVTVLFCWNPTTSPLLCSPLRSFSASFCGVALLLLPPAVSSCLPLPSFIMRGGVVGCSGASPSSVLKMICCAGLRRSLSLPSPSLLSLFSLLPSPFSLLPSPPSFHYLSSLILSFHHNNIYSPIIYCYY